MVPTLLVSIAIRLVALLLSLWLLRRVRHWSVALLAVALALMTAQQALHLLELRIEIPGLVVSVLALLAVGFLGKLLTDRARSAEALAEREQLFRSMVTLAQEGVWLLDAEAKTTFVNPRMAEMLGYAPEEMQGRHLFEFMDEAARADAEHYLERRRRGIAEQHDFRFRRKDGTDIWTLVSASPMLDRDGRVVGLMAMIVDITERKRMEEALRESSEFSKQILASAQEGVIVLDDRLRYVLWNPYMEQISGLKEKHVLGKHPAELFPFVAEKGLVPLLERALRGESVAPPDLAYHVPATGKSGWSSARLFPLRRSKGEIIGVIAMVHDITERKRAEEDLRTLSGRLLKLQDEERRRIARELHDTTAQGLAALAMNLALLKETARSLEPKAHRALAESLALADQALREIRTLAYLLHPPILDEVGLPSAVRWYADGFTRRSRIRVELDVPADLGRLSIDVETAVFRVVQEALTNVHRHSGSAAAWIRLSRQNGAIVTEVRDEGRGIAPTDLAAASGNMTRLGVGIAGMRERVRQLGGELEIHSSERGSTVRAVLPLGPET